MHELERFAIFSYSLRRKCPLGPGAFHGAHAALNALARSVRVAASDFAAPVIVIVVAEQWPRRLWYGALSFDPS